MRTISYVILWAFIAIVVIALITLPISLQAHLIAGTIVVGAMIVLKFLRPHGVWRLIALGLGTAIVLRYIYWRTTSTLPPVNQVEDFIPGILVYPAELYTRDVCTAGHWRNTALGKRIMQQLCRELLLLESSDWQFLITTGAARDYAEIRFLTHNDQFNEVKAIWQNFEANGALDETQQTRLTEIEVRDSVFPDIDPGLWVAGAKQQRIEAPLQATA